MIIIGSGLAGLNSALRASSKLPKGKILLVTKSKLGESNSLYAQGGMAAVFGPDDNFQKHIQDTMIAGAYHNDKKAVKYFVERAPEIIRTLQKLGVHFETKTQSEMKSRGGNNTTLPLQNQEAGHSQRRIVHVGDHTGLSIIQSLEKQVLKRKNITIWENSFAKDLIVKDKTCIGAEIIRGSADTIAHAATSTYIRAYARRIILATGGVGQLYQYTTNPVVTTGDGIALAARAGCRIKDMEFIQFHPTAFANSGRKAVAYGEPGEAGSCESPLFLISETVRGEGAKLLNARGERFMPKYHKSAELAPRDIVSRAIVEEQKKGPVFLDIRHRPAKDLRKKFPTIFGHIKKSGFDMSKNLIPVTPAAHYLCGGIVAKPDGETNIRNLYAVGEVACTGLQGANRLASNSLLEAAVMSEHVMDTPLQTMKNFTAAISKVHQETPEIIKISSSKNIPSAPKKLPNLRQKLQKIMWTSAGIIRTKNLLTTGLKQLHEIKKQLPKNPTMEKFALQNMLTVSELILKAALKRKQSLGAHYRKN